MGSALRLIWRTSVKKFPINVRHKLNPAPGALECTPSTSQLVPAANTQPAPGHGPSPATVDVHSSNSAIRKYCPQFELVETICHGSGIRFVRG